MGDLLKISTFGGLTIQRADAPVTGFVSRKVEALLVYLVCNPREHMRESLAELLWDDLTQARAMANLRMALSSLQQQLSDYVIVTRQSVCINSESSIWVDVTALEAALDAVDQKWDQPGGLSRTSITKLEEALDLYHGDFLTGFHLRDSRGFEDWQLVEQERLRSRVIEALMQFVQHCIEHNILATGIVQAKRLLQIDPLLEEGHRQLMKLLARAGQRNAALAQYETCRQILETELDVEPDDETTLLYQQIQAGQVTAAPMMQSTPHNLPSQTTPFVGRTTELAQIAEHLDNPDCRLLTLLGAGGIGKTRLALQAASQHITDFRHGVFFVSLAPVSSPEYVASAIVAALKISIQSTGDLKQQLINYLEDKKILLLLDNFDHVLDAAHYVSEMLSAAPALKLLITSRELLNLREEWMLAISGLEVPESLKPDSLKAVDAIDAVQYSAVQLFEQSAKRVKATFSLSDLVPNNLAAVIQICQLVEGMPLAIELAAAWLRVMPVNDIAAQIERDLDFLTTTHRNVPERHRSIRVLFEHSWKLLDNEEQEALMRLSVFRGGFEWEMATEVVGAMLPTLASLVEKSLMISEASGRYNIHELLRRFAYEKLQATGESEQVRAAHLAFFTQWTETLDSLQGMKQFVSDRLDTDYDNLREALAWALETKHAENLLRIGTALVGYWKARGYSAEGRYWLAEGLAVSGDEVAADLRAKALTGAGILAWSQSDFEPARLMLEISLKQYRALNDKPGTCRALNFLGYVLLNTGDYKRARLCYQQILKISRDQGDHAGESTALSNLGMVSLVVGDYDNAGTQLEQSLITLRQLGESEAVCVALINLGTLYMKLADYNKAKAYYEEGLNIARDLAHKPNIAITLANLGEVANRIGDLTRAASLYIESLTLLQELGDKLGVTVILERFAGLALDQNQPDRAALLLGAANRMRGMLNAPVTPRERVHYNEIVNTVKTQLGESVFDKSWSDGKAMSLDEAISFALA